MLHMVLSVYRAWHGGSSSILIIRTVMLFVIVVMYLMPDLSQCIYIYKMLLSDSLPAVPFVPSNGSSGTGKISKRVSGTRL